MRVVFYIILIINFASNIYANDKLHISPNVIPIIQNNFYKHHSKLYPIGINDSYFAYIKQEYSEGKGTYEYIFIIKDLINGKEKENILFSQIKDYHEILIGKNQQVIKKKLLEYKIVVADQIRLHDFPLNINNTMFTVSIENGNSDIEDFIEYHYKKIMIHSSKNEKEIGTVAEIVFAQHLKYKNYQVLGYMINDKKTRIIVVITYIKHEDEASDLIPDFKLFTTNLEVK
jgi:hypothetical protein